MERGDGMREVYYLVVLESINYANYLESELKKYGYEVEIIQTPQQLTNDNYNNISLKIYQDSLELAMEKIREDHLKPYKIYEYCNDNGKKTYSELKLNNEEYDEDLLSMLFDGSDDLKEEDIVRDTEIDEVEEIIDIESTIENQEDNTEAGSSIEEIERSNPIELIRRLYELSRRV